MTKDPVQLQDDNLDEVDSKRRAALSQFAVLCAGLTGAALAPTLAAAQGSDHAQHAADHAAHMHAADGSAKHQALIDAAALCTARGEVCLNHCMTLLGTGDTSMKDCIRTVTAMLATSAAVERFAASELPRLKELTKLCIDVCGDCEKECRKHEHHHVACKNCAEACAGFIEEGKKLIAS
ncbi:MAG TPA: four-helix bundle copper-binding protein [Hyphomicrobiales bacterium]|jgi:Cys-rich four helix bundle protein (predicted Tat secretion target)